jgi:hypothetical protein
MLSDRMTGRSTGGNYRQHSASLTLYQGRRDSAALDRDLRLDLCRGLALWCVFLDHIPSNAFSWLTLRHYGFSDATEVFMFVSGVTCALSYSDVSRRDGWASVVAHTLLRSWEIAPLAAAIPGSIERLIYPIDKPNLDPLRLLHFLAIAIVWRGSCRRIGADLA